VDKCDQLFEEMLVAELAMVACEEKRVGDARITDGVEESIKDLGGRN
jgi:hypothetical protein